MTCACTANAMCRACREAHSLKAIALEMKNRGETEHADKLFAIHADIERELQQSFRARSRTTLAAITRP